MSKNQVRLGISGDINKLKYFIQQLSVIGDTYHDAPIRHFSLGVRPWEKLENSLIDKCLAADFTISIHPVDINFSSDINLADLKGLKNICQSLPIMYIEEDIGLWRSGNLFLGAHQTNPPMNKKTLHTTIINARTINNYFELPVFLENPPIYSEFGNIEFWDFYLELCNQSNCLMAFDVGHYLGYCKSKDIEFNLPDTKHKIWKLIKTVHISGIKSWIWNGIPVWLDQHADPFNNELIEALNSVLGKTTSIYNILLEMEGAPNETEHRNISLVKNHMRLNLK